MFPVTLKNIFSIYRKINIKKEMKCKKVIHNKKTKIPGKKFPLISHEHLTSVAQIKCTNWWHWLPNSIVLFPMELFIFWSKGKAVFQQECRVHLKSPCFLYTHQVMRCRYKQSFSFPPTPHGLLWGCFTTQVLMNHPLQLIGSCTRSHDLHLLTITVGFKDPLVTLLSPVLCPLALFAFIASTGHCCSFWE